MNDFLAKTVIITVMLLVLLQPAYAVFPDKITITKNKNLSRPYLLCSDSMYPVFTCNSTLTGIIPENPYNLSKGDIIWFTTYGYWQNINVPRYYIVHRITEVYKNSTTYCERPNFCVTTHNDYYITKGDNNKDNDYKAWGIKVKPYMIRYKIVAIRYTVASAGVA